jgi:hypothetical protein
MESSESSDDGELPGVKKLAPSPTAKASSVQVSGEKGKQVGGVVI